MPTYACPNRDKTRHYMSAGLILGWRAGNPMIGQMISSGATSAEPGLNSSQPKVLSQPQRATVLIKANCWKSARPTLNMAAESADVAQGPIPKGQ